MTVHIVYNNFLDDSKEKLSVGGIQTYIANLIPVILKRGDGCNVYQIANEGFKTAYIGATVIAVAASSSEKRNKKNLYDEAASNYKDGDLLLYGCDSMILKKSNIPAWTIQHGVSWDKPRHKNYGRSQNYFYGIFKFVSGMQIIRHIDMVERAICVDNNFVCWYRTMIAYPNVKLKVIPNFSEIAPIHEKGRSDIKIIFARRFFEYRGTRIFGEAVKRILAEYDNVYVTIAGSGPDQDYFDKCFADDPKVEITKYEANESLKIHADKHIAVIPTVGSEGTSLSLLEAMSSQCAVVCTNVGGMTNIVLDGYNGLMISPDSDELYMAMKRLIDDEYLRKTLAMKAYDTVRESFSLEKWEAEWAHCFSEFCNPRQ